MQIDWLWLAFHSIWILGISISLTVAGFARYEHPGHIVEWRAGWWVYLTGQVMTIVGFLLSEVLWNWTAAACLWLIWTLLDRFVFFKEPGKPS